MLFFLNIFFLNNEMFFQLMLKIITQKNIWYQFFLRHQSMKRNSNQRLKRCFNLLGSNVLNYNFNFQIVINAVHNLLNNLRRVAALLIYSKITDNLT